MSRYKNQPPNFGIWALGYCVNDQRGVRLTMQGTQPTATTPLGPSVSIVSSLHHGVIFLLLSSPGGAAHLAWSPLCSGEDATSRGRVTRGQVPGRVSRTRHTRQPVPARVHTGGHVTPGPGWGWERGGHWVWPWWYCVTKKDHSSVENIPKLRGWSFEKQENFQCNKLQSEEVSVFERKYTLLVFWKWHCCKI